MCRFTPGAERQRFRSAKIRPVAITDVVDGNRVESFRQEVGGVNTQWIIPIHNVLDFTLKRNLTEFKVHLALSKSKLS